MVKKLYFLLFLLPVLAGCKKTADDHRLKMVTTIFPLYDFAREVGRDKVQVIMLLPPGTEAHTYEPAPQDMISINQARVFVYIGESMEPWSHEILESVTNPDLAVLEAGKNIEMMDSESQEEDPHGHGGKDPHIWLDFEISSRIVGEIAVELGRLDPSNRDFYLNNAEEYQVKLAELDRRYREDLAKCQIKTIMYGGHFTFGYLAKRYGITHISPYQGFSPDAEPTPQKIMEMVDFIRQNKTEVLFYEELLDPKIASAVSSETGVRLELLHGAHNLTKDEMARGLNFISIMDDNLVKLKTALKYQD